MLSLFGDLNDEDSLESLNYYRLSIKDRRWRSLLTERVVNEIGEPSAYHVLEEIGVNPNVWPTMTKIRNQDKA